jgi:DNA mismatch repair protein MutS
MNNDLDTGPSATPDYQAKTPMLQHYFAVKREHPGALLLIRVGDFFEAYGADAVTLSEQLGLTLMRRIDGSTILAVAGIPHHATERWVARLIGKGLRVALLDHAEDPKYAVGEVKREIRSVEGITR